MPLKYWKGAESHQIYSVTQKIFYKKTKILEPSPFSAKVFDFDNRRNQALSLSASDSSASASSSPLSSSSISSSSIRSSKYSSSELSE